MIIESNFLRTLYFCSSENLPINKDQSDLRAPLMSIGNR